jgi:Na+-translocating ferredoxin:NAD+ oxidoreductase RnfG subunit
MAIRGGMPGRNQGSIIKSMRVLHRIILLFAILPVASLLAHESGFPSETLKKVFPEATGFTARKKTLTAEQLKLAEEKSGSKVQRNDNPLAFYVALGKSPDGSGALGTVLMLDARGTKGGLDLALGVKRDGTVYRVLVTENHDDPGLSAEAFLDQINGKSMQSPLKVGQDIRYSGDAKSAQAVLNAIRRGLYLLAAAEGK